MIKISEVFAVDKELDEVEKELYDQFIEYAIVPINGIPLTKEELFVDELIDHADDYIGLTDKEITVILNQQWSDLCMEEAINQAVN